MSLTTYLPKNQISYMDGPLRQNQLIMIKNIQTTYQDQPRLKRLSLQGLWFYQIFITIDNIQTKFQNKGRKSKLSLMVFHC